MNEALLVVIGLGLIAGGSIVVIDSLIIRRLRRDAVPPDQESDGRQT
jgi:hypothetical protein